MTFVTLILRPLRLHFLLIMELDEDDAITRRHLVAAGFKNAWTSADTNPTILTHRLPPVSIRANLLFQILSQNNSRSLPPVTTLL